MADTNSGEGPQVFVGGGAKKKRQFHLPGKGKLPKSKKFYIGLAMFLILVAIAITAAVLVNNSHKPKDTSDINGKYTQVIEKAGTQYTTGNVTEAKNTLEQFLKEDGKNLSPDQYKNVSTQLANVYNELGDTKSAVSLQQSVLKTAPNPTYKDYYSLAVVCETAKDNACAVKNYKLALQALENDNGRPLDWVNSEYYIKDKIKSLGG